MGNHTRLQLASRLFRISWHFSNLNCSVGFLPTYPGIRAHDSRLSMDTTFLISWKGLRLLDSCLLHQLSKPSHWIRFVSISSFWKYLTWLFRKVLSTDIWNRVCHVSCTSKLDWSRSRMRVRAGLVTAVYSKALVLSNDERTRASGDIVNLMSVDATRLQDLCTYGLIAISGPLQVCWSPLVDML